VISLQDYWSPEVDLTEAGTYKPIFVELRRFGYVEGLNFNVARFSENGDASRYDRAIREVHSSYGVYWYGRESR
jgi:hypothetical protein